MTDQKIRFLSGEEVKRALPMNEAIEAMKGAFIKLSADQVVAPPRTHLDIEENNGVALVMPVYIPGGKYMELKLITLFGNNPEKGLPLIHALVTVVDIKDGRPLAIMDGTSLTAIRTGAASGAATDLLARENAHTAAIFGAGHQGMTQLEAVCAVRDIREAYIFDIDEQRGREFAGEMSEKLNIPVHAAHSKEELQKADIICTATTSVEPVFADNDLKPGVHINAVGSYKPHVREIPGETVIRARVIVDHRASSLTEAGDLIIPMKEGLIGEEHISAEVGEIASGKIMGRMSNEEITFFKSVGNAVQDLAAASLGLEKAEQLDLGIKLSL